MKSTDNVKENLDNPSIRLKHMFQTQNEDGQSETYVSDTLDAENLNKIVLKFENKQGNKMNLVNSVKNMIELSSHQNTTSLLDYIDDLKKSFSGAQNLANHDVEPLKNSEESIEEVNFDEIISKSEEILYQEKDKKSLLYNLINDINQSSKTQTQYNDEQFENNIKSMISDINNEQSPDDFEYGDEQAENEQIQTDVGNMNQEIEVKKGKKGIYITFFLALIMGLAIVFYLYQENIIDFLSNLWNWVVELVNSTAK